MDDVKIKVIDSDKLVKAINEGSYDINLSSVMAIGAVMLDTKKQEICKYCHPEQRWIPCCKTVDIPDHEIMACDKYGSLMFGYLSYANEQLVCESETEIMYDPIAWREKPEPYREEGDE